MPMGKEMTLAERNRSLLISEYRSELEKFARDAEGLIQDNPSGLFRNIPKSELFRKNNNDSAYFTHQIDEFSRNLPQRVDVLIRVYPELLVLISGSGEGTEPVRRVADFQKEDEMIVNTDRDRLTVLNRMSQGLRT